MKKLICIIIISTFFVNNSFSQDWISVGDGIEKNIYDLTSFDGNLYACGRLGTARRGVYFWDGTNWNNTNSIWGISYPLSLEVYDDELYTSGDFNVSNNDLTKVFKWGNGDWVQQGANFTGGSWNSVKKLKQFDNSLYAGGQFEFVGNVQATNIAKWNGQEWENVGNGIPSLIVEMAVFQDKLVVCHSATDTIQVNDSTFNYIPRRKLQILEDSLWIDLDSTFENKNINLLGVINDELYFGSRDTINGLAINNVGIWDGTNIVSIGDTLFHSINHVIEFNNVIHTSCQIKTSNPNGPAAVIRKRENNEWVTIGGVFNDHILTLHNHNNNLFIGGFFGGYENSEMKYVSMLTKLTSLSDVGENEKIKIYPNPVNSEVHIISSKHDIVTVEISSIDGRLISRQEKINSKEFLFNMEKLPSNIYLVKSMLITDEILTNKIIKN